MNAHIEYQTINDSGTPRYAVVPIEDFKRLMVAAGQADPTIPHAVISATVDGASPVRAWREYLGISQADVADRMGISQSAYSQMEASHDRLRKNTRERIAAALCIAADQLDF